MAHRSPSPRRRLPGVAKAIIGLVVCVGLIAAVLYVVRDLIKPVPYLPMQQCVVTDAGKNQVSLTPEQAKNAALIAGVATNRGLPPRAAIIALATAYQESGLRNLDHGDLDSIGLFQQRPSQGWGTREQILDPYYSSAKFYEVLVTVSDWQSGDINDVAQKVQRSGVPDGYRKHVANATVVGTALTGGLGGAVACIDRSNNAGAPAAFVDALAKTYGVSPAQRDAKTVTVTTADATLARAVAYLAVANTAGMGVVTVQVGDQQVTTDGMTVPTWKTVTPAAETRVAVTFR